MTTVSGNYGPIVLVNQSTVVKTADVAKIAIACSAQLRRHVSVAWSRATKSVIASQQPQPGYQQVVVFDDSDQQGALGYHDLTPDGHPYAKVFARPTLTAGGTVLQGANSVAVTCSHEICEMYGDPDVNLWADSGGYLTALELCDAVESNAYPITVQGAGTVSVSNFLFPEWFNADPPSGARFDQMGLAPAPFEMTSGGYTIRMTEGKVSQSFSKRVDVIFGKAYPEWKKPLKLAEASRTRLRQAQTR